MWLLPALSRLSRFVTNLFYRFRVDGCRPPASGPMLLVANHPNSLLDPALVAAAVDRPIRFLAKAPLFDDSQVGWLVRAAGAIPVYRRSDVGDAAAESNVAMFESVFEALAAGAAVGIFPEGVSHSEPSLAPLRTGAARIALGSYARDGELFPLIPIGLILRQKEIFRSEAIAVIGDEIPWADIAPGGADDGEAVRALTARIDEALRKVTFNLEQWEDRPLVEFAEAVWATARGERENGGEELRRAQVAARILADVRRTGTRRWQDLVHRITRHQRRLRRLGLGPRDLGARTDLAASLQWAAHRLRVWAPPALALAWLAALIFWPPYRATGWIVSRVRPLTDQQSTYKVLLGTLVYLGWVVSMCVVVGWFWHPLAGLALAALLPALGIQGVAVRERWRGTWDDVRRFFLLRSRRALVAQLRADQEGLARDLDSLFHEWSQGRVQLSPGKRVEIDIAAGENHSDASPAPIEILPAQCRDHDRG